ncbi:MAG: hypothetical protein LC115_07700 [Bacteroidia bacterium]|nr:hypothetical protein [Bacteroidia bacterium]
MKKIYSCILISVFLLSNGVYAQRDQVRDSGLEGSTYYDFLVSVPKITEKTFPLFMAEIHELRGVKPQFFCQSNQAFAFKVDAKLWNNSTAILQRFKANRLNLTIYEKEGTVEDIISNCQVEAIKIH